ncbi:TPA: hypothetical protein ACIRVE_003209 [Pseudomonas putida]
MTCITRVDDTLWTLINRLVGNELLTPYTPKNSWFRVEAVDDTGVSIRTLDGGSVFRLRREAFQQTLDYLLDREHLGEDRAIVIASNTAPDTAGPLCKAARQQPDGSLGIRVITYILPILEACQVVGIQRLQKPTTTWLINTRTQLQALHMADVMETYRVNGQATLDQPCTLLLDGDTITVAYPEPDGKTYFYKGKAVGEGHYELEAVGFDGWATLHSRSGTDEFEGFWREEGCTGMWRVRRKPV